MPVALQRIPWSQRVLFPNNGTVSQAVEIEGAAWGSLYVPSDFDGTTLTFHAAHTKGTDFADQSTFTWFPCKDGAGSNITLTVAAGDCVPLDPRLFGARYLRVTSGTTQSPATYLIFVLNG